MIRRLFRTSIRFKVTALATVLAVAILGSAAVAMYGLQRQQLHANLDSSLAQRADAFEATLSQAYDGVELSRANDEDRAIQVVDLNGSILVATRNITGHPPLRAVDDPLGGREIITTTLPLLEDDAYRILSRGIDIEGETVIVHVAQNVDDLNDTLRGLAIALAVAVPAVVALLGTTTWWLVGRTLRPVEEIRAEVADISSTKLDRRVPVSDQGDEIAKLAQTMNEMLDRLDGASMRQRQFIADASHELRTPLTRIRTEVEVDINQPGSADPALTNAMVLEETIALQTLLDDLLFLARSDENRTPPVAMPVDLDDIVLSEVAAVRDEATVSIDTTGVSAAHVTGDSQQLARAVRNLLSNALRHARSTVAVTVAEDDQGVEFVVTDDGSGVPAEATSLIFERFARADDARTRSDGGAGLGLAIARDIAVRHQGQLWYEDAPSGGARFVLRLPTG